MFHYFYPSCASILADNVLQRLGVKRPLIVTDRTMVKLGIVDMVSAGLPPEVRDKLDVFADTIEDPDTDTVAKGLTFFRKGNFDGMVAIGGGSPMDTAKAIAVASAPQYSGPLREYKAPFMVSDRTEMPAVVAIPTTAGTGSEVTRFTVITDNETKEKMLIAGSALIPEGALVDHELTKSCPPRVMADTAIDALTHAIEAYVSRRHNVVSDALALVAIRRIATFLPKALLPQGPEDIPLDLDTAYEQLARAATEAGLAFSHSSVAAVHGMSRPMGVHFGVPHGLSNAMLLPAVVEWTIQHGDAATKQRYGDVASAFGLHLGVKDLPVELARLNRLARVSTPKEFGIPKEKWDESLELMAEQAIASGSPGNNPVVPEVKDMVKIYRRVYHSPVYGIFAETLLRQTDVPRRGLRFTLLLLLILLTFPVVRTLQSGVRLDFSSMSNWFDVRRKLIMSHVNGIGRAEAELEKAEEESSQV